MDFGAASALHQAWPSFTSPLLSPSQEAIAIIIPTAKFHTHHFWWPLSEIILICVTSVPPLPTCWPCYLCEQPFAIPAWICDSSYCCWWHCGSQVGERSFKSFSSSVVTQSLLCLCCVCVLQAVVVVVLWSSSKIQSRPYCCDAGLLFILGNLVCNCNLRSNQRAILLAFSPVTVSHLIAILIVITSHLSVIGAALQVVPLPQPPPSLSKGVALVN